MTYTSTWSCEDAHSRAMCYDVYMVGATGVDVEKMFLCLEKASHVKHLGSRRGERSR